MSKSEAVKALGDFYWNEMTSYDMGDDCPYLAGYRMLMRRNWNSFS